MRLAARFGPVVDEPATADEMWWVTVEPGDYLAFAAPWHFGIYDT